eukprot:jgi/Ulvmu1/12738/UM095_0043.1
MLGKLLQGVVSSEWEPVRPVEPKAHRQYAKPGPKRLSEPVRPTLSTQPTLAGKRVWGQGLHVALKTKVALKIVDQAGQVLLIRDLQGKGHRRSWQIPSLQMHAKGCVHLQGIIMARGFIPSWSPESFVLAPHSFMSGMRLGQPMVVVTLQATVQQSDVEPSQAGFTSDAYKWVSHEEYRAMRDEVAKVLYMRSPWYVRGSHPAVAKFHSMPGVEPRDHLRLSIKKSISRLKKLPFPTLKLKLLFVVAACVYNPKTGKVLVAERRDKHHNGMLEWPGGKMDPGETTDQAVIRELKEEIDIKLDHCSIRPVTFIEKRFFDRNLVIMYYSCSKFSGTARGAEGQKIEWLTSKQLEERIPQFTPGDEKFATIVLQELLDYEARKSHC